MRPTNLKNQLNSPNSPKFIPTSSNLNKANSSTAIDNKSHLPSTSKQAQNSHVQANISINTDLILLRTAIVHIEHMGELFMVRALIDPGSQRTFLSERIRNRLQIPTRKSHIDVVGIGGQIQTATKECELTLVAKRSNFKFSISAIILPKVTKHLPSISFEVPKSQLDTLDLADPTYNKSSQIDLILGNDSERFINIEGVKKNVCGLASAYNTIFGWVLSGPVKGNPINTFTTSVVPSESSALNDILRKFWEQEELPDTKHMTEEDQYCQQFYAQTTIRKPDGRYMVRLPFKKEFPKTLFLGPSRIFALGQYSRMKVS